MNSRLLLAISASLLSAGALRADLDLAVVAEIRVGKVLPPPPPEVEVIEAPAQQGPPPWAPAHGFRRNRGYYYYPDTNVYFRPADRTWFYLEGRDWRIGASLPTAVRVDLTRAVSLEMETDRPFEFHSSVKERYPTEYFSRQVKIKGGSGKSPGKPAKEISPVASDSGRTGGSGKGKGKGKDK
ncbi:MAG TPA: hypothetical protein VEB66_12245 [Opitutaceae bacterium]|nr:hypothetical protein [Opitutaceae bacterium]